VGERILSEPSPAPRTGSRVGPFAVFGVVAVLAGAGAIFEMSYWVGTPALSGTVVGTTLGIAAALVAFFVWGLRAPPNE
jgi:hypothetical protein